MMCGFLALSVLGRAQNTVPLKGGQQQQHSPTQAHPSHPSAPLPLPVDAQKDGGNAQQETENESKAEKYLKDAFSPAYLSNWALVAFGVIGGIVAIITLRLIYKQSGHMERQTKILEDSVAAAQKSADAAIAQVDAAKRTQRAQLRIEFADFDFGFDMDSKGYQVRFTVTLDGTTRAYILSEAIIAYTSGLPPEKRSIRKQIGLPKNFTPEISPIGTYTLIQTDSGFPEVETDVSKMWAIRENKLFLFVNGYVLYRDIFGDMWRLEFSQTWKNWSSLGDAKAVGGMWSAADMYGGYRHSKVEEQPINPN